MAENVDVKEKKAVTRVSPGALAKLLRLPPDVDVKGIESMRVVEGDSVTDVLSIQLGGDGLPDRCATKAGEPLQTVGLVYRVTAFAMLEKIE